MGMHISDEQLTRLIAKGIIEDPRYPSPLPAREVAESISEKDFQSAVIAEAKRLGWRVYHTQDSRKSEAGFPDLVMLRGPRIVAAELKVGTNKPTANQEAWLESFRDTQVPTFLWYPIDWPTILDVLK